jgi:deoxyguanosine kinase
VEPENNPFLDRFYQELSGMALATQMWFLVERYDQMRQAAKDLAGSEPLPMVADYLFEKDKLFAYINSTMRSWPSTTASTRSSAARCPRRTW